MAQGMARAPETAGEPVTVTVPVPVPVPQGHTLEGQRSLPTPFLTKTYRLVDDPAMDDVISWNEDGSTFVVWRPAEFARDILPKYFKHNNFSSFVRQLNTYGFRKIVPDRWEFANDCFRRGEKRLLCDIHRRKIVANATSVAVAATAAVPPPQAPAIPVAAIPLAVPMTRVISPVNSGEEQVLSSNSSPGPPSATAGSGGGAELKEENERLRKENAKLLRELTHMKNLCNHISVLISQCSSGQQNGHGGAGQRTTPTEDDLSAAPVLELMPGGRGAEDAVDYMEDVEAPATTAAVKAEEVTSAPAVPLPPPPPGPCPRLFGVPLGLKRGRPEEDGEDMETEGPHALPEVKPEPEDSGSEPKEGSPEPKRAWVIYCPRPTRPACDGSDRGGGREREPDGACT